jgi:hypothetical protein
MNGRAVCVAGFTRGTWRAARVPPARREQMPVAAAPTWKPAGDFSSADATSIVLAWAIAPVRGA